MCLKCGSWCHITSAHGFSDFISCRSTCKKLVWLLAILLCVLALCQQLLQILTNVIMLDAYQTSIYQQSHEEPLQYPEITICSYNRIKNSEAVARGLTETHQKVLLATLPTRYPFYVEPTDQEKNDFFEYELKMNKTYAELIKSFAPQCEDLIQECSYRYLSCFPCASSNRTDSLMTHRLILTEEFGSCVQLIPNGTRMFTETEGMSHGIRLKLNLNKEDQLKIIHNNFWDEGFAIHIGRNVNPGVWTSATSGFRTQLGLQKVQHKLSTSLLSLATAPCSHTEDSKLRLND